jgi:hypothetical protein
MCDKCIELDDKIEHYERISVSINDQLTIDRIKKLVEQMKAQKAALHPEREYKAASVGGLFYFEMVAVWHVWTSALLTEVGYRGRGRLRRPPHSFVA